MGFNTALMYGVIIAAIVSVASWALLANLSSSYGLPVETKYQPMFNKYNETFALYSSSQETIEAGDINPLGFGIAIYKNVIVAAKTMMAAGNIFMQMLFDIPSIIPIPSQYISMIITLVLMSSTVALLLFIAKKGI